MAKHSFFHAYPSTITMPLNMTFSSFAPMSSTIYTILCILLVPLLVYIRHVAIRRKARGFPFMKLPPEIRLQIYEHIIDDYESTTKPTPKPDRPTKQEAPTLRSSLHSYLYPSRPHIFTVLSSINQQIRSEFLQIYSQRSIYTFTLDATHTSDAFSALSPRLLSSLQTVHLKILASPDLVGGFDPRVVTGSWQLRDRVFEVISRMQRLRCLRLSIQACGNELWNPIWLWHYTSQSFKTCKTLAFKRMSFDLEGWNMREPNHLERNASGAWEWRCSENHLVLPDVQAQQPVREFCGALYAECRICDSVEEQRAAT